MEFTEKQLERLVEDVKGQLSQLLKGEEEKKVLAKSEAPAPAPKVEEKPLEKKEESSSSPEAKKAEESSLEKSGPAPAPHAPKDRGPTAKAEESESETEKSKDAKKAEESSSSMEKAYKEMSKAERETHYKALKRFIWEDQGFEIKKAEESSKACKAEESSSAKKAEESSTSTAEKAESSSMSKAEEELVAVKVENDALKKNVEQLIASLEKVIVKGPDRKSIAGIGEIALPPTGGTSETVAEPVLKSKLNDLTRSDKLTKAERDLINDYCLFGKGRPDVLSIVKDKSK